MKSTSGVYYSQLDHLRFFAACLVFYWHFIHLKIPVTYVPDFAPLSLLAQGHTGVALFMTLSGFLFTKLTLGRNVNAAAFYRSRFFRIFPLHLFWLVFFMLVQKWDPVKLLVGGFFLLSDGNLPGSAWTVIVELQFYVIFPFLLYFYNNLGPRFLLSLLLLSILLKFIYFLNITGVPVWDVAYTTIIGRMDQFLLGMLAAHLQQKQIFENKRFQKLLFALSLLSLIVVYRIFSNMGGFYEFPKRDLLWIIFPSIEGVLYAGIISSYYFLKLFPPFLDKLLARLGEVSYSMYLGHYFFITSLSKALESNGLVFSSFWPVMAVCTFYALPGTLLFSGLTYHLIEYPFLLFRKKYLLDIDSDPFKPLPQADAAARTIKISPEDARVIMQRVFICLAGVSVILAAPFIYTLLRKIV